MEVPHRTIDRRLVQALAAVPRDARHRRERLHRAEEAEEAVITAWAVNAAACRAFMVQVSVDRVRIIPRDASRLLPVHQLGTITFFFFFLPFLRTSPT